MFFGVDNVWTVLLKPPSRKSGLGVHICLAGTGDCDCAYKCGIAQKNSLGPQKHLIEKMIFIVRGWGKNKVLNEEGRKVE